jgi:hypothetical protein
MSIPETKEAPERQDVQKRGRGRPKRVEPGSRLHISVPQSLVTRVIEMRQQTHAGSISEVVKRALALYAAAVAEHRNGGRLYFKREGEAAERELALFV